MGDQGQSHDPVLLVEEKKELSASWITCVLARLQRHMVRSVIQSQVKALCSSDHSDSLALLDFAIYPCKNCAVSLFTGFIDSKLHHAIVSMTSR